MNRSMDFNQICFRKRPTHILLVQLPFTLSPETEFQLITLNLYPQKLKKRFMGFIVAPNVCGGLCLVPVM